MLTPRALLVPSVPTLLIDERRGTPTPMIAQLQLQAEALLGDAPDAVVVVSSRWIATGPFQVDASRRLASLIDLPDFGVEPRYDCAGQPALARALLEAAGAAKVRAANAARGADTGVSVPMHFLSPSKRYPVVPVSLSRASRDAHRAWGASLRRALDAWKGRAALVVSGAITFSQHEFNLRRETPASRELDEQVLDLLQKGDWARLAKLATRKVERVAPEAGLLHLEVLRGFLMGDVPGRLCAYETLPGVGTALVEFAVEAIAGAGAEASAPQ